MLITTDVVSSYSVSCMSCWIGRIFDEEWWGAVTSPEMTSPEVVSPEVPGNDVIGSDQKLHHRKWPEMTYMKWRSGKCKGDNSPAFFLTGFSQHFFFGSTSGSTRRLLGVSHRPQPPLPLANHGSPYMSNESVRTIYFDHSLNPFLSSNQIQMLTFVFSNLKIGIFAPTFIVTGCVYLEEYSGEFIFEQR